MYKKKLALKPRDYLPACMAGIPRKPINIDKFTSYKGIRSMHLLPWNRRNASQRWKQSVELNPGILYDTWTRSRGTLEHFLEFHGWHHVQTSQRWWQHILWVGTLSDTNNKGIQLKGPTQRPLVWSSIHAITRDRPPNLVATIKQSVIHSRFPKFRDKNLGGTRTRIPWRRINLSSLWTTSPWKDS